ncbi:MAG: recombination protein RecR [Alphaproteobacteria bacterium]|nr:recombination protein RecR [Alphaproteobacteria bacterium]
MIGSEIEQLIKMLSRLPGLGPRSARRVALYIVKKKDSFLGQLIKALKEVEATVSICSICGNYDSQNPCHVCASHKRDSSIICVVQDVADLWAMERTSAYNGKYHVLGGNLSALDGIGPDDLNIEKLIEKLSSGEIKEVILALSATVEGQITVHYIADRIKKTSVKVSGIAHGVPVGGELDYLDDGTIQTAINARREIN